MQEQYLTSASAWSFCNGVVRSDSEYNRRASRAVRTRMPRLALYASQLTSPANGLPKIARRARLASGSRLLEAPRLAKYSGEIPCREAGHGRRRCLLDGESRPESRADDTPDSAPPYRVLR